VVKVKVKGCVPLSVWWKAKLKPRLKIGRPGSRTHKADFCSQMPVNYREPFLSEPHFHRNIALSELQSWTSIKQNRLGSSSSCKKSSKKNS
jgi:hypothetical protein